MFLQGAYKAAALLHHPDKAGSGQDAAFQQLQAAWEVRAVHHAFAWLAALASFGPNTTTLHVL